MAKNYYYEPNVNELFSGYSDAEIERAKRWFNESGKDPASQGRNLRELAQAIGRMKDSYGFIQRAEELMAGEDIGIYGQIPPNLPELVTQAKQQIIGINKRIESLGEYFSEDKPKAALRLASAGSTEGFDPAEPNKGKATRQEREEWSKTLGVYSGTGPVEEKALSGYIRNLPEKITQQMGDFLTYANQPFGPGTDNPYSSLKGFISDDAPTREKSGLGSALLSGVFGLATGGAGWLLPALMGGVVGQGFSQEKGLDLGSILKGALAGTGGGMLGRAMGAGATGAGATGAGTTPPVGGSDISSFLQPQSNLTFSGGGQIPSNLLSTGGAGMPSTLGAAGGSTMPTITDPIAQYMNNLLSGGQPYQMGGVGNLYSGGQPYMDYSTLLQNIGQGVPQNNAAQLLELQKLFTQQPNMTIDGQQMPSNIPTGTPNLGYSGSSPINPMDLIQKLLGRGDGDQQQDPTLMSALNDIFQGVGGAGTLGPAAMLAYLNQKQFDYPSPPDIEWPSLMEQARTGAMQPEEYGIASQKLQGLLGADPTQDIMNALRGQQELDYERWMKQVKPSIAGQGQLDSTYWSNLMGEPLREQGVTSQNLLAQLGIDVPQMQAGFANQLAGIGGQRAATDQGWYGQGLQQALMANAPAQRGFELEYQKVAGNEAAKNQAEQLWSAIMAGNMFPQNPVLNPQWGNQNALAGLLGGNTNYSATGQQSNQQSDWQKLLGYGQTGLNVVQTGKGLWDLGSSIGSWFS